MSEPVKWFTTLTINGNAMAGMPRCSGTAGDLIACLDFFLNTGGNLKTLTGLSRTDTTATATFSGAPGFIPDQVVLIAGANQSEWNGEYRLATLGANSVTFTVPGTHTASPTGTITMKAAPAGWTCTNDGGNIYRAQSADVSATQLTLRVDDSGATYARVRGWTTWDSGAGTGPFPTDAQISGGEYVLRSSASGTAARNYICVADGALLYLFTEWHGSYTGSYEPFVFGDFNSWLEADGFRCCIVGSSSGTPNQPNYNNDFFQYASSATPTRYMARDISLLPDTSSGFSCYGPAEGGTWLGKAGYTWPSPLDGGSIIHGPIRIVQSASIPRGEFPGLVIPFHAAPFANGQIVGDFPALPGLKFIAVRSGYQTAQVLLQINGSWR
jgi:hypothetical protein